MKTLVSLILGLSFGISLATLASAETATQSSAIFFLQQAQLNELNRHFDASGNWKGTVPPPDITLLTGIDLSGSSYTSLDLPANATVQGCLKICSDDINCRGFTFVPASVQGPAPRCWLTGTRSSSRVDARMTSGTVTSRYVP